MILICSRAIDSVYTHVDAIGIQACLPKPPIHHCKTTVTEFLFFSNVLPNIHLHGDICGPCQLCVLLKDEGHYWIMCTLAIVWGQGHHSVPGLLSLRNPPVRSVGCQVLVRHNLTNSVYAYVGEDEPVVLVGQDFVGCDERGDKATFLLLAYL